MKLEPFEQRHMETFSAGAEERLAFGNDFRVSDKFVGKAIVLVDGVKTLGIASITVDCGGNATASVVLSDELRSKPMLLHRLVKKGLKKVIDHYRFNSLNINVRDGDIVSLRWAERLGFKSVERKDGFYLLRWTR